MDGDATLFAREDNVEEAWRIVDPALTWIIREASRIAVCRRRRGVVVRGVGDAVIGV